MSATPQVSDASFKEDVLDSELPVLVDFWAPWCGPCRMVAPVVDEIAQQYIGRLKVVKLNTDENPNTASQYGIRSIPTLMIFRDKIGIFSQPGALPESALEDLIEQTKALDMDEIRKEIETQSDDHDHAGHSHSH